MTVTTYLGIGSNLGDRLAYLQHAVDRIGDVTQVSSVYETEPVDVEDEQPPYLNAVLRLETDRTPEVLLKDALAIEAEAHRIRTSGRIARTLDIDILLYGELIIDEPGLQVPHPRMWQRRFVIEPLRELAPALIPDDLIAASYGEVVLTDLVLRHSQDAEPLSLRTHD